MSTITRFRRFRRFGLALALVALVASGCAKNEDDSDEVRDLVDTTAPNPFRFIYEVDQDGRSYRVQGLIEDDLRYKLQLSIDGRPALEQVVVDDAVAVRFLAPGLVESYIDEAFREEADLATDVAGATVLDALAAQRWVLDPVGAPSLLLTARDAGGRDDEGEVSDDPLFDARTVLAYVRSVADRQPWRRYDPESLEPTYRSDEDPFLAPQDGSGVARFDTVLYDLPNASSAGGGTSAAFPGYLHSRKMAVYAKGGKVFSVREHTQLTPRQTEDLVEYATAVLEGNAPEEVIDDFTRTIEQLPADKVPQFLLDGINAFRKSSGQQAVRFRDMAFELQDLGDPAITVELPTDQVVRGSLAILRNMGRKPVSSGDEQDATTSTTTASPAFAAAQASDG